MKTRLILVLLGLGAFASVSYSVSKPGGKDDTAPANDNIERFADYQKWTRVNPKPVKIEFSVATLCAPGNFGPATKRENPSPHSNKYLTVYVNAIGEEAMLKQEKPVFPEGSIIIKEKLDSPDSETPVLLTAMVKREPGYNSRNGDWEYVVLNGTASEITADGKLSNCQSCHVTKKATDYVYRNYLPEKDEKK